VDVKVVEGSISKFLTMVTRSAPIGSPLRKTCSLAVTLQVDVGGVLWINRIGVKEGREEDRGATPRDQNGTRMTSLEVILAAAVVVRSRAIGYPLPTADDRQMPPVVAHEWPGGE
jgi:hypothetical protein